MALPTEIERPHLLVVEGPDDLRFFTALLDHMALGKDVQSIDVGGKENMRRGIGAIVRMPRFAEVRSLGIIRDSDVNPMATFQSVSDALRANSLPVPRSPAVVTDSQPRIGVMTLPNPKTPGAIEDLCLISVVDNPAMDCVNAFFSCLDQNEIDIPNDLPKAKVQAYLASRPGRRRRLGEAAEAGVWPWTSPAFEQVKDFLLALMAT